MLLFMLPKTCPILLALLHDLWVRTHAFGHRLYHVFVSPAGDPSAALVFGTPGLDRTPATRTGCIVAGCAPLFLGVGAKGEFFPLWTPIAILFCSIAKVVFGE